MYHARVHMPYIRCLAANLLRTCTTHPFLCVYLVLPSLSAEYSDIHHISKPWVDWRGVEEGETGLLLKTVIRMKKYSVFRFNVWCVLRGFSLVLGAVHVFRHA